MIDEKATLKWLDTLCTVAMEEARAGNTGPATQLGSHPATQYYFHLVHTLRTISPEQWARDYPPFLKEIDAQRQFQENAALATETQGKVKLLEDQNADLVAKLDALSAKLDTLFAASEKLKTRKPKPAPVPESEEEGDTPAAAPGEGDSEPTESE